MRNTHDRTYTIDNVIFVDFRPVLLEAGADDLSLCGFLAIEARRPALRAKSQVRIISFEHFNQAKESRKANVSRMTVLPLTNRALGNAD